MINDENRYLFNLAFKSIRQNANRSFFIGFSVSLAVIIAVWVIAFFDGLNKQIEDAVVNTNTGHFQIQEPLYASSTDSSRPLVWTDAIERQLLALAENVSPELVLDGNIFTPEGAAGLTVLGVDPDLHQKFLPIASYITEGLFINDQSAFEIVVGQELAQIFKFQVGDQLILNYQDVQGELKSELLTIVGIFHFNSKSFEKRFVYINQKTWQELFFGQNQNKTLFNRVTMMTQGLDVQPVLEKELKSPQWVLKSWKNLNPEMAVVLEFHDGMIRFFFLIIGITIIMTILTPVRMLWQERFKELKMMSILGISKRKFWKLACFEVIQMICFSSLFSTILLFIIIGIQSQTGIDFRFLNESGMAIERAGIKIPGIIYPQLSVTQIAITFLFVILILGLSYTWSIHRTLLKLEAEQ